VGELLVLGVEESGVGPSPTPCPRWCWGALPWGVPPGSRPLRSSMRALPGAARASSHVRGRCGGADLCHRNQTALRGLRDRDFTRRQARRERHRAASPAEFAPSTGPWEGGRSRPAPQLGLSTSLPLCCLSLPTDGAGSSALCPSSAGLCLWGHKGKRCSILLLLLPALSVSRPLGWQQGRSSLEPAASPGCLLPRGWQRPFPQLCSEATHFLPRPRVVLRLGSAPVPLPAATRLSCLHPLGPALPGQRGFAAGAVLAAGPWEGRGGLGRRGSAFQHRQWGIHRLSTIIKYCLHCLLTER